MEKDNFQYILMNFFLIYIFSILFKNQNIINFFIIRIFFN